MQKPVDVLVIEDDEDISELVEFNLVRLGFSVRTAFDGLAGLKLIREVNPRLILLDIMMPECDGLSVLRQLRLADSSVKNIPVILLTAKGEESDIVSGLELGADDYVSKPFSPKELVARVRAVLKRVDGGASPVSVSPATPIVSVGPVSIDLEKHEVQIQGKQVAFTLAEFNLLNALISRPGKVFTRDQLLDKITGGEACVIDRNVDVHIRSIRRKLDQDQEFVQTVRGVGYKCREV